MYTYAYLCIYTTSGGGARRQTGSQSRCSRPVPRQSSIPGSRASAPKSEMDSTAASSSCTCRSEARCCMAAAFSKSALALIWVRGVRSAASTSSRESAARRVSRTVWSVATAVHESKCVRCQKVSHNIYIYVYLNIPVYEYHSVEYVKLSDTLKHVCGEKSVTNCVKRHDRCAEKHHRGASQCRVFLKKKCSDA